MTEIQRYAAGTKLAMDRNGGYFCVEDDDPRALPFTWLTRELLIVDGHSPWPTGGPDFDTTAIT